MIKRLLATIAIGIVLAPAAASAGPVLDEILNYMYLDQSARTEGNQRSGGSDGIQLTKDSAIGQTLVTGPETDRVIRVRLRLRPDGDWHQGEGAELILWDSPEKKVSYGRYTIWYEYRGAGGGRPDFEINAKVLPNTPYYFEISYAGDGDGKLSRVATVPGADSYPSGQGYLAGKEADFDVNFQTHAKRPMDRVGNLKKMFDRFNLDMPQLAEVRQAVESEDFEAAISRMVAYFEARQEPVSILRPDDEVKHDPSVDTKDGDLAMYNFFQSGEMGSGYAGPDLNWRSNSRFNPDGTLAANDWATGMNRYGPRGPLSRAYMATGNDKYVRKLNDVLIDWYMDNPPPTQTNFLDGGNIWATLQCGIRLSHGFICYSRISKSPFFTTDGRMAYFLNQADNADTLITYGENDGGNWSFTQNAAMYELGLNFPEFKNANTWRDTAAQRFAATIKKDILADGIETESAPGYQRMSYGPIANFYKLTKEREPDSAFAQELKKVLSNHAEYFMHLAMPNGVQPFLGDWGDQQERPTLLADSEMLGRQDLLYVATFGEQGTKPSELSKLYPHVGIATMRSDWGDSGEPFEDARHLMLHGVHFGSHGHHDLNGITCYAYGRELLADPGSAMYGSPEHNKLGSTASHNLMTIDGQELSRWPKAAAFKNWSTTPVADYLSSWVTAYEAGDYNREVFFVRSNGDDVGDYWVIRDTAEGTGRHSLEQRWHMAFGEAEVDQKTLTARSLWEDSGNLAIMQVSPAGMQVEQSTTDAWRPRGYFEDPQKMPTFVYTTQAELPAAIDTVLFPYKGQKAPDARIISLAKDSSGMDAAFKMVQGQIEDLFVLRKTAASASLSSEKIAFDGEKLFLRRVGGKLRSALLINGRSLSVNGRQVIKSAKPMSWVSVSFDASGAKAYASASEPSLAVLTDAGKRVTVTDTGSDRLLGLKK